MTTIDEEQLLDDYDVDDVRKPTFAPPTNFHKPTNQDGGRSW